MSLLAILVLVFIFSALLGVIIAKEKKIIELDGEVEHLTKALEIAELQIKFGLK